MDTITTLDADLASLKQRQQATWAAGDYAKIGSTLQIVGETLCEAVGFAPGARVLDGARRRAQADGFEVEFRVADAEALPFADGEFDAVLSSFGVMFTANQERAAAELLRVVRRGGRIGMANWTPEGFIGQLFGTIGRNVPPPAVAKSPARWGTVAWLEAQFPGAAIRAEKRDFVFRYLSATHMIAYFRAWYGPMLRAFGALDAVGQAKLTADIGDLIDRMNFAEDGTVVLPSEYLEVVVTRR